MMAKEMVLGSETMVAGFVRKAVTHNRLVSTFRLSSSGPVTASASSSVTASASVTGNGLRCERYQGSEGRCQKPTKNMELFHMLWLKEKRKAAFLIIQRQKLCFSD
jgi:hypothetical protein